MKNISVQELKERIDRNEKINLLDVRELSERQEFNIGGKHLSLNRIQQFDVNDIDEWKEQELIVYCRSGGRSMQACLLLEQMGFSQVKNLLGGVLEWQKHTV